MRDKFVGWAALTQLVTEVKTRIAGRIAASEKGASNGVATLDATGRVPYTQLPESAMEFEGGWDASTNNPELKDGTGDNGDFYVCNVAGTVNFGTAGSPRNVTFYANDRALYDGNNAQWIRLPASEVRSVNGMSGDVNITAGDIGAAAASDITNAIDALDVSSVGGSGKYISAISETNGKISATAGDISGTVTVGDSAPVSGGAVADILSNLPTDAILHYSFDEVPDLPDGTAVYKKDNDFTDTTGWSSNGNTPTVTSGKITLSGNNDTYARYSLQISANSMICVRGIANKTSHLYFTVRYSGASSDTTLKEIDIIQGEPFEIYVIIDAQSTYFNFYVYNSEWSITLSQIYIGDGSYSTPIIDNANGQNNATNNGGIAVKGVSGKGAYFLRGKYADIGNFNLAQNFTISVWVKPNNNTQGLYGEILTKSNQFILRNGADWGGFLMLFLYGENSTLINAENLGVLLTPDVWTNIIITRDNLTCYCFLNGIKIKTIALADNTIMQNTNPFYICKGNRPQSFDDLLIFNRALTEKEVIALYYNKANTPKYFQAATEQTQANWNETNQNSPAFIQNKPSILTVQDVQNEIDSYYAGTVSPSRVEVLTSGWTVFNDNLIVNTGSTTTTDRPDNMPSLTPPTLQVRYYYTKDGVTTYRDFTVTSRLPLVEDLARLTDAERVSLGESWINEKDTNNNYYVTTTNGLNGFISSRGWTSGSRKIYWVFKAPIVTSVSTIKTCFILKQISYYTGNYKFYPLSNNRIFGFATEYYYNQKYWNDAMALGNKSNAIAGEIYYADGHHEGIFLNQQLADYDSCLELGSTIQVSNITWLNKEADSSHAYFRQPSSSILTASKSNSMYVYTSFVVDLS